MSATALLAIDWGTSAARASRVDGEGRVQAARSVPLGIKHVRDGRFEPALAKLLGDWSASPVPRIACGMIGSRQGWVEAPYVDCPASLMALADRVVRAPQDALTIVPGRTPCLACLCPEQPVNWKREFPVFSAVSSTVGSMYA